MKGVYKMRSKVWLHPGHAGWHFITVPKDVADKIRENFGHLKKGWGSLPVVVTIRKTEWKTSIFPDRKSGTYLLGIKAEVRRKEKIEAEDTVSVSLRF